MIKERLQKNSWKEGRGRWKGIARGPYNRGITFVGRQDGRPPNVFLSPWIEGKRSPGVDRRAPMNEGQIKRDAAMVREK